jgi:hypothetical protein
LKKKKNPIHFRRRSVGIGGGSGSIGVGGMLIQNVVVVECADPERHCADPKHRRHCHRRVV